MASEQSARERLLEQASREIERNPTGSCADCHGIEGAAPEEWPHFPGCYATVNKALDLALARIADLEQQARQDAVDHIALMELGRMRIADLERERDEARKSAADLRKLFDDAGQGEHNVLALIDHYQHNSMEANERLRAVCKLLEENGCDCPCDHHPDERGPDCEVCLACRIDDALKDEREKGSE